MGRTATNIRSGARLTIAAVVHSLVVLLEVAVGIGLAAAHATGSNAARD